MQQEHQRKIFLGVIGTGIVIMVEIEIATEIVVVIVVMTEVPGVAVVVDMDGLDLTIQNGGLLLQISHPEWVGRI